MNQKFLYTTLLLCLSLNLLVKGGVSLTGVVHFDGEPLAEATVRLRELSGVLERETLSNAQGFFAFRQLPTLGSFRLSVMRSGFQTHEVNLSLAEGQDIRLDIPMTLVQPMEQTTVTTVGEIFVRPSFVFQLSEEALKRLPTNREMSSIFERIPGTPDGKSFFGGALVDNNFTLDGGEAGDPRNRLWDTPLNVDAIALVQASTGGLSASSKGGQGALVEVITKRGSNHFEGSLRLIKSRTVWNKRNKFNQASGLDEERIATTFGGPIIRDRLWFFTSFETRGNQHKSYYFPTAEAFVEGNLETMAEDTYKNEGYYLMTKLNANLTTNQDLELVFNTTPMSYPGWLASNNANRDLGSIGQETRNYLGKWQWHPNQSFVARVKGQYKERPYGAEQNLNTTRLPLQTLGYQEGREYHPQHTGPYTSQRVQESTRLLELSGTFFGQYKELDLQVSAGVEVSQKDARSAWIISNWVFYDTGNGSILYADYTDEAPWKKSGEQYMGLFVQSKFEIGDHWQLNFGLRGESFEQENAFGELIVDSPLSDLLAPRINLAYQQGPYQLTASWGRYYGLTMHYAASNSSAHDFSRQDAHLIYSMAELEAMGLRPWANAEDWVAINPEDHPEFWREVANTYQINEAGLDLDGTLKVPYTDSWTLNIERSFAKGFRASIHFMDRSWYDSYEDSDLDHNGVYTISLLDARWRHHQALTLNLSKDSEGQPLQFNLSYTHANTSGYSDWGQLSFYLDNHYNIFNQINGRPNTVPNQAKLSGSYDLPFGVTIGVSSQWRNGGTWTPYAYVRDTLPGSAYRGWLRTNYEPQGSRRLEPFTRTDLHLAYDFPRIKGAQIHVTLDVQNVLNQQRVLAQYPYIGFGSYNTDAEPGSQAWYDYVHQHAPEISSPQSRFGEVTSYSEPRTFMANLGVRF